MTTPQFTVEVSVSESDGTRKILHVVKDIDNLSKAVHVARRSVEGKTQFHATILENGRATWDYHCNGMGGRVRCSKLA